MKDNITAQHDNDTIALTWRDCTLWRSDVHLLCADGGRYWLNDSIVDFGLRYLLSQHDDGATLVLAPSMVVLLRELGGSVAVPLVVPGPVEETLSHITRVVFPVSDGSGAGRAATGTHW